MTVSLYPSVGQKGGALTNQNKRQAVQTMKTTIYLPVGMWQTLRVHAIQTRTSATKIVEKLIEEYMRRVQKKGGSR